MNYSGNNLVNSLGETTNYAYFMRKTERKAVCCHCGKEFNVYFDQVNYAIKGNIGRKRKEFCSWTCKSRWKKEHKFMEYEM